MITLGATAIAKALSAELVGAESLNFDSGEKLEVGLQITKPGLVRNFVEFLAFAESQIEKCPHAGPVGEACNRF